MAVSPALLAHKSLLLKSAMFQANAGRSMLVLLQREWKSKYVISPGRQVCASFVFSHTSTVR